MNKIELAKECQVNSKAEADAVLLYTEFLGNIINSDLTDEEKEMMVGEISELISDELNHSNKLNELYTRLTDIEPNKE